MSGAEALGIIAGGVGIAAAAGQLLDGIVKLQSFCSQIKDFPRDLQTAIDDVTSTTGILEWVKAEMAQNSHAIKSPLGKIGDQIIQNLQDSLTDVEAVLSELERQLGARRLWGRVKATTAARKLEKAQKRVFTIQCMLTPILVLGQGSALRHDLSAQSRQLFAMLLQIQSQNVSASALDIRNIEFPDRSVVKCDQPRGAIRTPSKKRQQNQDLVKLAVKLPFILRALEIGMYRMGPLWGFTLRPVNIIDSNAEIFQAIHHGHLPKVRALLSNSQASLWDQDHFGDGLLHCAAKVACKNGSQILEFLVQEGLDIHLTNKYGVPAWHHLGDKLNLSTPRTPADNAYAVEAWRVFTDHPQWQDVSPTTITVPSSMSVGETQVDLLALYLAPPEEILCSMLQRSWPPWNELAPKERLEILFPDVVGLLRSGAPWVGHCGTVLPSRLRCCLPRNFVHDTFRIWELNQQSDLAATVLEQLARTTVYGVELEMQVARSFLADFFAMGCLTELLERDLQMIQDCDLCMAYVTCWSEDMYLEADLKVDKLGRLTDFAQRGLIQFVRELEHLGMEMSEILKVEDKLREQRASRNWERKMFNKFWWCAFTVEIFPSARAEDWRLSLSFPVEVWLRGFWDMINHPERNMPGSWPEDR